MAKTAAQLRTWQSAPLEPLDLVALILDGVHIGDIDLGTSSRQVRRVVYSRSWTERGTHTIEVRSLGGGFTQT